MEGIESNFSEVPLALDSSDLEESVGTSVRPAGRVACHCAVGKMSAPLPPSDESPKAAEVSDEARSKCNPPQSSGNRSVGPPNGGCGQARESDNRFRSILPPELTWLAAQCRPVLPVLFGAGSCLVAAYLLLLLEPFILRWIIDDAVGTNSVPLLFKGAAAFAGCYCGYGALLYLGQFASSAAAQKVTFRIQMWLVHRLQSHTLECRDNAPWDDLLHHLERDIEEIGLFGAQALPSMTRIALTMAFSLFAMSELDMGLTLAILPLLPLCIWVHKRFRRRLVFAARRVRRDSGNFSLLLQEQLIGLLQLQLLNRTGTHGRKLARAAAKSAASTVALRKEQARWSAAWMGVGLAGSAIILGYGGYELISGGLTVGGIIAYCLYTWILFRPLLEAVRIPSAIRRTGASIRRIEDISSQCHFPPPTTKASSVSANQEIPLEFRNVSFAYSAGRPVLKNASFVAHAGENIALVGPKECGKTAIAYLITRLYDPAEGSILLNGRDTRTMDRHLVRAEVSLIPQYPVVFSGSLRDNLLYGRPSATDDEMMRVIHATQLDSLLHSLPAGLNEPLGLLGLTLSESERKRVALARALLRRPQILILDELTGLLDGQQMAPQLLAALDSLPAQRVILAISHRPSSVTWADRILLLDRNQILAQGTHEDLLKTCERYRDLYWDTLLEDSDESESASSKTEEGADP